MINLNKGFKPVLKSLLPPVAYDVNSTAVDLAMAFDAIGLDKVLASAVRVLNALNPATAGDALSDWERVYNLKKTGSYAQRVEAVIAKINAIGGLSIPYFIQLAKANGITITIDEPQPFRAGINRAGHRLAAQESIWLWVVNIKQTAVKQRKFRAGLSLASERLLSFERSQIETLFNELKPAHTLCHFNYLTG